uniref:hypothetical protein n=1 Tax=Ornithobacterium rhinotracheale TaxID=28251 RepID=UPI0039A6DBAB
MLELIKKYIFIMGILSSIFSCRVKKDVYIYRTEVFYKKEKELKISLDEATNIYSTYILKNKKENETLFCRLDIIYGDYYIFKKEWEPYNLKTGNYNLSGIWINGYTGEIEEVTTHKNIRIILEPSKHLPYVKKIIDNKENK